MRPPCESAPRMPARIDLGPKPRLGYTDSRLDRAAEKRGYVWSQEKALHVQGFIEDNCRLYVGRWAGQPMRLFAYQQEFIWQCYGWVHKDTGLRRFREAYLEIAKKNAKKKDCRYVYRYRR